MIIEPFKENDTREQRKAKIWKINAITEELASMMLQGDHEQAKVLCAKLDAAGILVNDDDPTLWQAEIKE